MIRPFFALTIGLLLAASFGCASSVPPRVTVVTPISDFGEGRIFVKATRLAPRLAEALRSAGLPIARGPAGADLVLDVRMGAARSGGDCGKVHNIQGQLMQETWTILRFVARGATGHCSTNVIDQIAVEVKSFLDANRPRRSAPAKAPAPPPPPPEPVKLPEPEVTEPVKTGEPPIAPAPRQQLGGAD
jgi:hypothetical protein